MKKHIEEPEFDDCFDRLWKGLKSEFFKCETCQVYTESEEDEFLALFRAGKTSKLREAIEKDVAQDDSVWQDSQARGVEFLRVHVFSEPLSEYIRFELLAYEIQARAGEKIWMVPLEALNDEERKNLKDFMLFDLDKALIVDHNEIGTVIGAVVTEEPSDIARLRQLREKMLHVGIPLSEFVDRSNKQ